MQGIAMHCHYFSVTKMHTCFQSLEISKQFCFIYFTSTLFYFTLTTQTFYNRISLLRELSLSPSVSCSQLEVTTNWWFQNKTFNLLFSFPHQISRNYIIITLTLSGRWLYVINVKLKKIDSTIARMHRYHKIRLSRSHEQDCRGVNQWKG
jgi:hypothetical protein